MARRWMPLFYLLSCATRNVAFDRTVLDESTCPENLEGAMLLQRASDRVLRGGHSLTEDAQENVPGLPAGHAPLRLAEQFPGWEAYGGYPGEEEPGYPGYPFYGNEGEEEERKREEEGEGEHEEEAPQEPPATTPPAPTPPATTPSPSTASPTTAATTTASPSPPTAGPTASPSPTEGPSGEQYFPSPPTDGPPASPSPGSPTEGPSASPSWGSPTEPPTASPSPPGPTASPSQGGPTEGPSGQRYFPSPPTDGPPASPSPGGPTEGPSGEHYFPNFFTTTTCPPTSTVAATTAGSTTTSSTVSTTGGPSTTTAACSQDLWPLKAGGRSRSGYTDAVGPGLPALLGPPTWQIQADLSTVVRGGILIHKSTDLIFSTIAGSIVRFDKFGQMRWQTTMETQVPQSLALGCGDLIYVATKDGLVHALQFADGLEVWATKVGMAFDDDTGSVLASEGQVFVASRMPLAPGTTFNIPPGNNFIVALDGHTGKQLWNFTARLPLYNAMISVNAKNVFFADEVGNVTALNRNTGQLAWTANCAFTPVEKCEFSTGGAVLDTEGTTLCVNSIVSLPSGLFNLGPRCRRGRVSCYRAEDGVRLWSTDFEKWDSNVAPAIGPVTVGNTKKKAVVLILGANPPMLVPFQTIWQKLFSKAKTKVVALDASTGQVLWRRYLPEWGGPSAGDTLEHLHLCVTDIASTPAIDGSGVVYFGHASGVVYSIMDYNGDAKIQDNEIVGFDTKNAFQGTPAIGPGILAVTPCNGVAVWLAK